MNTVGERVRDIRSKRGLSRERLAVAARCSTSTVQRLERSDAVPNLVILTRIADELEVSLTDLLTESVAS